MYKSTPMTSKHFIFYIIGLCTASLLIYPSIYIQSAENNVVISILSSFIMIIAFTYISKSYLSSDAEAFDTVVIKTLGKAIGKFYLAIFILMTYLSIIGTCAIFSTALSTSVFIKTPTWFILIIFIGAAYYIKLYTSRSSNIFIIISSTIMIIFMLFLFILLQKYRKLDNIDPTIFNNLFNGPSRRSLLLELGGLSTFGMLLPLFKNIRRRKNDTKNIFIGLLFVAIIFIFSLIGGISVFGAKRFSNIYFPLFIESQIINYQGILENGDALTLLILTYGYILKYIIEYCSLSELLPKKIKSNIGYSMLSTVIIFFSACFLSKNTDVLFRFLNLYQYALLVVFMVLPLTIFLLKDLSKN